MIVMQTFLTALQWCILQTGMGSMVAPWQGVQKDHRRSQHWRSGYTARLCPCQLRRHSQSWPHGTGTREHSLRDCGNTRFKHLGEIPGTQRDRRAAVSFLHSPSVFSSSQHSVVAITHRLNSVIFNPVNTSLFKIISARRPRGGRMAGSL